jgi:excisionase family DNA binding protein
MVRKGEIGMTGDILTATEVAGRLRVSLPWLYKQIKAGVIPHLKVGGVIRFRESDLNNWMDANKIENQKQ